MPGKSPTDNFPPSPGCYLFRDSEGKVIYVGKAKNLKKRASSYFSKGPRDAKTEALVARIDAAEFIATGSEYEAFILENNLIKRHQPKYNIALKDSKRYGYLEITTERFPRLVVSRSPKGVLGKDFFGPFVSGSERELVLSALRKAFRIRTCRRLPKKACLLKDIGLCDAPCIGGISEREYSLGISRARKILSGRTGQVEDALEREIAELSGRLDYESAIRARDQLRAIRRLSEKRSQFVEGRFSDEKMDVLGTASDGTSLKVVVLNFSRGLLLGKSDYSFDTGSLPEFVERYYSLNPERIPGKIIVPEDLPSEIGKNISLLSKRRVDIVQKGASPETDSLLGLARKNAELLLSGEGGALRSLKEVLLLQSTPEKIECFDISHLSGEGTVGSMVFFRNGLPEKSSYRRFKIRSVEEIDDFASIREVVFRRYSRLISEGAPLPDLIVIDGGFGQLSSAKGVLDSLGLSIPLISLAKREETICLPGGKSISLPKDSPALKTLQFARDEAHRFAVSYNRLLVRKGRGKAKGN